MPGMSSTTVRFAREALTNALWDEARPLLEQHWREIAHYPDIALNPDRAVYDACEASGVLRFFTVRRETTVRHGLLHTAQRQRLDVGTAAVRAQAEKIYQFVGYAVFFVRANPHYSGSLQAVQDVLYLDPSARGSTGSRFIDWCDIQLQAEGVQATYHHVKAKPALNFGPMLERKGYELVDLIYAKRLDR